MENQFATNNKGPQLGRPGTYRLVEHEEEIKRGDRKLSGLTFRGLHEIVIKRSATLDPKTDSFEVNVQACTITLNINECGGYRHMNGRYEPQHVYVAQAKKTDDANLLAQVINKASSAEALTRFFKQIPHLFVGGEQACKTVLKALRNVNIEVANILKTTGDDVGQRTKSFEAKFVDQPTETKFSMRYAMYQGEAEQDVEFSLSFELNEAGTGVEVWVRNPMMPHTERKAREAMMALAISSLTRACEDKLPFIYVQH